METTVKPSGSVDHFLEQEHLGFERVLQEVALLNGRYSYIQAAKRFGEFRHALERHLRAEDQMLLPLFVKRTGDPGNITPTFKGEHQILLQLMADAADAISQWDDLRIQSALNALMWRLRQHHRHEEQLLHPAMDALLQSESDWRSLFRDAQASG